MKFGILDAEIAKDRDLPPAAKLVYAILRGCQNPQTGQCNPTRATIAEMTGLHIKSVSRSINLLIDHAYLTAENGMFRMVEGNKLFPDREQFAPSEGTNCSLQEDKLLPRREQIVPPYNKDEKKRKRKEKRKGKECAGAIISDDPGYTQPSPEQQQIARDMLDLWDELYPATRRLLTDRIKDEVTFITLQTVHGLIRPEGEDIVRNMGESIEFWPRPNLLTQHVGNNLDKPLVFREIQFRSDQNKTTSGFDPDFDFIADKKRREEAWNATH